jgi:hypothetical protein
MLSPPIAALRRLCRHLWRRRYRCLLATREAFAAELGRFSRAERGVSPSTSVAVLLAVALILTLGLAVIIFLGN